MVAEGHASLPPVGASVLSMMTEKSGSHVSAQGPTLEPWLWMGLVALSELLPAQVFLGGPHQPHYQLL